MIRLLSRYVPIVVCSALSATSVAAQRYVLAPEGNEARYRVREQLVGKDLPNDAVGRTSAVEATLVLDKTGIVAGESKFVIDLTKLETDQRMRDGYVRRSVFKTDSFPQAVFVPKEVRGTRLPLADNQDLTFELIGDLTLRGVTKPVTWIVTARRNGEELSGTAKTNFKFGDFELPVPKMPMRVMTVEDDIRLEYDFKLVAEKR